VLRRKRIPVDGVLLLDKPKGISSNDVLQKVRRLFNAEKTGHTGTLDPLASGLLPLLFGEATKFSSDLLDADKTYVATVRLGFKSSTGDAEGVLEEIASLNKVLELTEAVAVDALNRFVGEQLQTPPMYSALKHEGRALYEYAREGVTFDRPPRAIYIRSIRLLELALPELTFEVRCSKGTYIRVLGEDIGNLLGFGGYLTALRRTEVANLSLGQAYTAEALSTLANQSQDALFGTLLPADTLLKRLPAIVLPYTLADRFIHGQRLPLDSETNQDRVHGRVRVYSESQILLGTAFLHNHGEGHGLLSPERLIRFEHDTRA
jgi:tRNA pseudouridine55 synthase